MRKALKIALPIIIASSLVLGVFAAWYLNRPIAMHGIIIANNNFQVYSDSACTTVLSDLDWGSNLKHGDVTTKTLYMKNIGDTALACSWNVTNGAGFTFTATNNGDAWLVDTPITGWNAGGILTVVVTMTVGPSTALGSFSSTLNLYSSGT
jgi:hypothetical protein